MLYNISTHILKLIVHPPKRLNQKITERIGQVAILLIGLSGFFVLRLLLQGSAVNILFDAFKVGNEQLTRRVDLNPNRQPSGK